MLTVYYCFHHISKLPSLTLLDQTTYHWKVLKVSKCPVLPMVFTCFHRFHLSKTTNFHRSTGQPVGPGHRASLMRLCRSSALSGLPSTRAFSAQVFAWRLGETGLVDGDGSSFLQEITIFWGVSIHKPPLCWGTFWVPMVLTHSHNIYDHLLYLLAGLVPFGYLT